MTSRATNLPAGQPPQPRVGFAAALVIVAVVAAYWGSLGVPFLFDDVPSIVENPALRGLAAWWTSLMSGEAGGLTTSGRPVLALSFVLNHALGGHAVAGYHLVNLAIHAAAALCLLGLVRRTLELPVWAGRFRPCSLSIATAAAALWALHPMQTAAVTYVVQRAESLAALWVLATLYTHVRGAGAAGAAARRWRIASVAACLLGMGTKETAVVAPVLVLLHDRAFVSGTFRGALAARGTYYAALAATWLPLIGLVAGTGGRGGTAGLAAGISPWSYALTQCQAVLTYAGLGAWPYPLIFDYGMGVARDLGAVLPQALALAGLVAGAIVAIVRRPALGFFGACFLLPLAPSSSFIPVATQTMAEHRFYLPLAAPIVAGVLLAHRLLAARALGSLGLAAGALLVATVARNRDYRSEAAIWGDAAAKQPANARAHNNLGQALFRAGDVPAALAAYERALLLQPKYPETHYNRGVALARLGRPGEAIGSYETAVRLDPRYPEARNNLGNALVQSGRADAALAHYEAAIAARPDFPEAHNNLGNALLQAGRAGEAAGRFRQALALRPGYAEASYNLGNALAASGAMREAIGHYDHALALRSDYAAAHVNAGNALLELGRATEAAARYEQAIQLNPRLPDAHFNLASLHLEVGRWREAVAALETVLRIDPAFGRAHRPLGFALAKVGRAAEALVQYDLHLRSAPGDLEVRAERERLRASLVP
ncbi:MAG: tetratricopeptide repeat protein [Opitutaceae bacterium]|nr:tetratricopeptide repeat protein [Opitutaceae bacterium]